MYKKNLLTLSLTHGKYAIFGIIHLLKHIKTKITNLKTYEMNTPSNRSACGRVPMTQGSPKASTSRDDRAFINDFKSAYQDAKVSTANL